MAPPPPPSPPLAPQPWLDDVLRATALSYAETAARLAEAYRFACGPAKFLHHGRVVAWTSHDLARAAPAGWLQAVAALPHAAAAELYCGGPRAWAAVHQLPQSLQDFLTTAWRLQVARQPAAMPEDEVGVLDIQCQVLPDASTFGLGDGWSCWARARYELPGDQYS